MRYAQVVVDIVTRDIDRPYDYAVPDALVDEVSVGATVLVTFSHRAAIGYVVGVSDALSSDINPHKIRAIEQVLAAPAFDECAADIAIWISQEYACSLPEACRLFIAPGQKVRIRRRDHEGPWELVNEQAGPVDDRWIALTDTGRSFTPRRNAARQRELLAALAAGPVRMAELTAMMPGAGQIASALGRRGVVSIEVGRRIRGCATTTLSSAQAHRPAQLTQGQVHALATIDAAREAMHGDVVLVDGVTGSGKTEVYLDAIAHARAAGTSALVLVPEISLTAQTVGRFRNRFGDDVAVLHSRLSVGERFDQWDMARRGEVHVVVGARSALFAPLRNLGLIIIDEEHEGSYKQDSAPRYHAREVAAQMARMRGCALVLGSATPSLESLERCRVGSYGGARWTRVAMPERPGDATLPTVDVIDMTAQFAQGNRSVFSTPLADALEEVVRRREKAVLLLNRRGFATFLMCRECGCVPECPHCSTSLTYHERTHELVCHSCGRSWPQRSFPDPSTRCPHCGSRYLAAFGVGTQRVEDEVHMLLAHMGEKTAASGTALSSVDATTAFDASSVDVIRMDADTTRTKNAHQHLLETFDAAECAVLVGTQMIAKGLDFPEVTLVGVINADTTLKLPDFRAAERTYDLLEQVAGRAGRGRRAGRVIVQSYWAAHPAIQAVVHHDRTLFLEAERAARAEVGYPPFARLSNIVCWGTDASQVKAATERIAREVRRSLASQYDDGAWDVLGPAACVKARVKDRVRRHMLIKTPLHSHPGPILLACVRAADIPHGVRVAIDVDAYDLL